MEYTHRGSRTANTCAHNTHHTGWVGVALCTEQIMHCLGEWVVCGGIEHVWPRKYNVCSYLIHVCMDTTRAHSPCPLFLSLFPSVIWIIYVKIHTHKCQNTTRFFATKTTDFFFPLLIRISINIMSTLAVTYKNGYVYVYIIWRGSEVNNNINETKKKKYPVIVNLNFSKSSKQTTFTYEWFIFAEERPNMHIIGVFMRCMTG